LIVSIGIGTGEPLKHENKSALVDGIIKEEGEQIDTYLREMKAFRLQPKIGQYDQTLAIIPVDTSDVEKLKSVTVLWIQEHLKTIQNLCRLILSKQFFLESKRDLGKYIGASVDDSTRFEFNIQSRVDKSNFREKQISQESDPQINSSNFQFRVITEDLKVGKYELNSDSNPPTLTFFIPEDSKDSFLVRIEVAIINNRKLDSNQYYGISGSPIRFRRATGGLTVESLSGMNVTTSTAEFYEELYQLSKTSTKRPSQKFEPQLFSMP